MSSQTRSCGLGQTVDRGGTNWSSPTNVYASDDARANTNLAFLEMTDYLWCTTFGFSIPSGATINGVKVYMEKKSNRATAIKDDIVQLIRTGSRVGSNKAKTAAWATTDTYSSYGSSTNMWGTTLTPAQVNASNFGVVLAAENAWYDGLARTYCDHVYIIVYYTYVPPLPNMKVNISDTFRQVSEIKINVGDSWRTVTQVKINIGDVWRAVFG